MCTPASSFALIPGSLRQLVLRTFLASPLLIGATALGSTVDFWLSNSLSEPVAPAIRVPAGAISTIDIWVRPPDGATLKGFSLNLAAEQAGAVEFTHVKVHDPLYASANHRHQFVVDSDTELLDGVTYNDAFLGSNFIEKFVGTTVLPDGEGIGPDCDPADTVYCSSSLGGPAWRIATVTFEAGMQGNSTELFLEIGQHGLWLENEVPTDTDANFGADEVDLTWNPNATPDGPQNHKGWLADAVITVVGSDGDFDDDGDVDGRDFLIWQRGYSLSATAMHGDGDANGDKNVNAADLAIWQAQYGTAAAPLAALVTVPEPTSSVILGLLLLGPASRNLARKCRLHGLC